MLFKAIRWRLICWLRCLSCFHKLFWHQSHAVIRQKNIHTHLLQTSLVWCLFLHFYHFKMCKYLRGQARGFLSSPGGRLRERSEASNPCVYISMNKSCPDKHAVRLFVTAELYDWPVLVMVPWGCLWGNDNRAPIKCYGDKSHQLHKCAALRKTHTGSNQRAVVQANRVRERDKVLLLWTWKGFIWRQQRTWKCSCVSVAWATVATVTANDHCVRQRGWKTSLESKAEQEHRSTEGRTVWE